MNRTEAAEYKVPCNQEGGKRTVLFLQDKIGVLVVDVKGTVFLPPYTHIHTHTYIYYN